MAPKILQKSFQLLTKQQTNILSAAFVLMSTVLLSQILGLVRQRLLVATFGASNVAGSYLYATRWPELLFQLIIAGALSSAFIPIFSQYIGKGNNEKGHDFASNLISIGLGIFIPLSVIIMIFADFFAYISAPGLDSTQLVLVATMMRIMVLGQLLFIIASFLSAILQSYNRFFIPGIALSLYNLGIIIGILTLSHSMGIYSAAWGVVIGAFLYVLIQLPFMKSIHFHYRFYVSFADRGIREVMRLMWPRTISLTITQLGVFLLGAVVSLIHDGARNYLLFDYAQILAFAPVTLLGVTIAQASFPVLSRQKENLKAFNATFITSFNQMLYLILPVSVLFLVLRIPLVRLVYGASAVDWQATVLTGRTVAFFSISIFAQALLQLVLRAFYALHDTKIPLVVSGITTMLMVYLSYLSVTFFHFGIFGVAGSYSLCIILNLSVLLLLLHIKTGGFITREFTFSIAKIFTASFFTAFALYIPIKLLDRLVFDTTKTVNLLILTGISSAIGTGLYLFLTWLFNVHEASTYLLLFKKIGNWRAILGSSEEPVEGNSTSL